MKPKNKKKWILTAGLLVLLLLTSWARWRPARRFHPAPPGEDELRVVTWNVGYFAPVADKNLKDTDLENVLQTLKRLEADVIVLQELGQKEQADWLTAGLGGNWTGLPVETGHGNQVMAVFTPLRIQSVEARTCGGRESLAVTVLSRNGQILSVTGVHSPHPARGLEENLENIRCAFLLSESQPAPVRIVTGDLNYNFDPGSDGDLYREISEHYGDGSLDIGETYYAWTRIDHVFHWPKDLPVNPEGSGLVDLSFRFAGVPGFRDHRPLVVTYLVEK